MLQKSLAYFAVSDSVTLMRFAMEAVDDGAAQARSGAVFSIHSALVRLFRTITRSAILLGFLTCHGCMQN